MIQKDFGLINQWRTNLIICVMVAFRQVSQCNHDIRPVKGVPFPALKMVSLSLENAIYMLGKLVHRIYLSTLHHFESAETKFLTLVV